VARVSDERQVIATDLRKVFHFLGDSRGDRNLAVAVGNEKRRLHAAARSSGHRVRP